MLKIMSEWNDFIKYCKKNNFKISSGKVLQEYMKLKRENRV